MQSAIFRAMASRLAIATLILFAGSTAAFAQNALSDEGLFVSVPNPITSEAVARIKNRVEAARANATRPIRKAVFEFNPNGKDASTVEFGVCYELASYISRLNDLTTIAFVSGNVSGHTVLPVVACRELVMSRTSSIGDIVKAGDAPAAQSVLAFYDEVLGTSREPLRAVVRKMADKAVSLGKGQKNGAVYYVDLNDIEKYKKAGVTIPDTTPLSFAAANTPSVLPAERAKQLGLSTVTADSRREVAELYQLSANSLKEDPLGGRPPVAFKYTLRGIIDGGVREAMVRIVEDVIRQKGNVLFLEFQDSSGGDISAARDLADRLIKFQQGENPILIVAFIPQAAPDTAAIVALGCSEIVMSRRKDEKAAPAVGDEREAVFGDFETFLGKGNDPNRLELLKKNLSDLAGTQGYPVILVNGMLDRDMAIVRVRAANERGKRRLMTEAEFEGQKGEWVHDGTIKNKGQLLKLNTTRAVELGIARFAVDNTDMSEVFALYGIDSNKVRSAMPSWLDRFADFIRKPPVTVLLVVIGFAGLILELKLPGTTVPGIIAALAFILVFWAHSQYSGQTAILGGLIFLLGLVLILIEMFVLPGFGVSGILGILFMVGGIGLATFDKIPETSEEWTMFGGRIGQYFGALMAAVVVAVIVARYLPHIPYMNRMVLLPPSETDEAETIADLPGAAVAAALLGAIGTSATQLRPSGMAQFGDQYVDVVTEGGYIASGMRVQVVEVEGTRIVVKEV